MLKLYRGIAERRRVAVDGFTQFDENILSEIRYRLVYDPESLESFLTNDVNGEHWLGSMLERMRLARTGSRVASGE